MGYGKSKEEAEKLALQWEAAPGTSEHELGICVDISSEEGDNASAGEVWSWLDENCWKYGFIKRYPNNKSQITGVRGEPWHYRYVGTEAAEEIMEKGVTLEEYLGAVPAK
jgi:D-alanyl-D-alanine carboxypeptidase